MKATILLPALAILLSLFTNINCHQNEKSAPTILIDSNYLAATKLRIENKDPQLVAAFEHLIEMADHALEEGPYAVTQKEKLPPSGDQHDYASYSRYWWPNPETEDGLPYIRRDGETFPGSQSPESSDRPRIGALGNNAQALGLAYYLTGKKVYAKKAAELLRVWFLDEATRMNPNLNHAQCRLGHNTGTKSGVLDGRLMVPALEGAQLIRSSSELTDQEYEGLKNWANTYFDWLTQNELALKEAASKNNHGSYYDAQAMYFALYAGNEEGARQIAENFIQKRINTQIQPDGSMPHEMARTRPLFYSMFNLHAIFLAGHLAEKVNVDIWQSSDPNSKLRAALDFLVPYADPQKPWPQPTLSKTDRMELFPILQMAQRVYPKRNYLEKASQLPDEVRNVQISNLAFPLMR